MNQKTYIFKINDNNFNEVIECAASIIKKGGTVAFPTETVYGLGADALNSNAVCNIFKAKNRPPDNPLIVHIHSIKSISNVVIDVPDIAFKLMDKFWPGPLAIILNRKNQVPDITTSGLNTVVIRMPNNEIALELIRKSGKPIAAPSANLSGKPSPTEAKHVIADLNGKIDAIIDGGFVNIGLESTIIDLTSRNPTILRPGSIGIEEIMDCIGDVDIGYGLEYDVEKSLKSPGMKYTHYSPDTKMILVEGEHSKVVDKIIFLLSECHKKNTKVGILCIGEYEQYAYAKEIFILGNLDDYKMVARNLFKGMRFLDEKKLDLIIVDGSNCYESIGVAIHNRLKKAADECIQVL